MTEDSPTTRQRRRRKATTDRRKNGDSLPAPNFRAFIDHAVQGIIIHHNFKPLYVNQAFAKLFGFRTVRDVMELPILRDLVPKDEWQRFEEQYDELMRGTKDSAIARVRALTRNAKEIWVLITMRAVDWPAHEKTGNKNESRAMMLTALDITKEVELEHNLLKTEQRLRAVLEVLPYPIYIARRGDGQILFVNRKSCILFQQSAGQLLRGHSSELYVDPKDRENLGKLLENVPDLREVEVQMKTGQGRIFTAEIAAITLDYGGHAAVLVALNDISQRKEMEAELFRQASTDALTGISNRRYLQMQAEQEMRRARRFARDLSVMLIDIDHFKAINDTHGHAIGDAVIQNVVKRSQDCLRQSDSIGRIGGEEFAVLLPETPLTAAYDVAERLRVHMQERPIIAGHKAVPCTVSIGVAQLSAHDGSIDELFHRADLALYAAKNSGRNRVERAPEAERN